jgi:hypothetical protein
MTKKVFYLMMTLLMMMSATRANAQVRIGGLTNPNQSAVLDLNPDTGTGSLGLALPRVALTSTASFVPLQSHVAGMMVYNTVTTGDVAPGAYFNDGSKWLRIGTGTLTITDSIVGNEVTNATSGGGLTRAGNGTASSPFTLGIADGGVTTARLADDAVTSAKIADGAITTIDLANNAVSTDKIANGAVTAAKLASGAVTATKLGQMGASSGQTLVWNGSAWAPKSSAKFTKSRITGTLIKGVVGLQWANVASSDKIVIVTGYSPNIKEGGASLATAEARQISTSSTWSVFFARSWGDDVINVTIDYVIIE